MGKESNVKHGKQQIVTKKSCAMKCFSATCILSGPNMLHSLYLLCVYVCVGWEYVCMYAYMFVWNFFGSAHVISDMFLFFLTLCFIVYCVWPFIILRTPCVESCETIVILLYLVKVSSVKHTMHIYIYKILMRRVK